MDTTAPNNFTTLLGGAAVTAVFQDGTTEEVKIQQLAVKHYPKLQSLGNNEPELVALYCGKDAAWVERLTPASHTDLITKAEELNADFFSRWQIRQQDRAKKLPKANVGEMVQILEVMNRANPELVQDLLKKGMADSAPAISASSSSTSAPPAA
jgi:hypothetical protein